MCWPLYGHIREARTYTETDASCTVHVYGIWIGDDVDYPILLNEMVHSGPLTFDK